MRRLPAALRARVLGAPRTTLAGATVLAASGLLALGADGLHDLAERVRALGELVDAVTGVWGRAAAALAGAGLVLWAPREEGGE